MSAVFLDAGPVQLTLRVWPRRAWIKWPRCLTLSSGCGLTTTRSTTAWQVSIFSVNKCQVLNINGTVGSQKET